MHGLKLCQFMVCDVGRWPLPQLYNSVFFSCFKLNEQFFTFNETHKCMFGFHRYTFNALITFTKKLNQNFYHVLKITLHYTNQNHFSKNTYIINKTVVFVLDG